MKLGLRHLLGIALLASLAVNVLLAGIVIGRWVDHGPHYGSSRFDREAAREALSPEARAVVDEIWERHHAAVRDKFKAAKQARRDFEALLQADEVDRAALDRAQAEMSARWAEARAEMVRSMTELALALSPEDRKAYFERGRRPHGQPSPPPGDEGAAPKE